MRQAPFVVPAATAALCALAYGLLDVVRLHGGLGWRRAALAAVGRPYEAAVLPPLPSRPLEQVGVNRTSWAVTLRKPGDAATSEVAQATALPQVVSAKIRALVQTTYSHWVDSADRTLFPLDSLAGSVRSISAPQGRTVYLAEVRVPGGGPLYYPILYDSLTHRVTPDPLVLSGRWMDGVPPVSFDDLYGDGNSEVVLEQRCHNGTDFNATVQHYYYVAPDLQLRQVLWLETSALDPSTPGAEELFIARTLEKLGPARLREEAFLEPGHRKLGEAVLGARGPGRPFHIVSRRVFDSHYDVALFSVARFYERVSEKTLVEQGAWCGLL